MICPVCGETMTGDGAYCVIHCVNAHPDSWIYAEPDARPVPCSCCVVDDADTEVGGSE